MSGKASGGKGQEGAIPKTAKKRVRRSKKEIELEQRKANENQKISKRSAAKDPSQLLDFGFPPSFIDGEIINQGSVVNKNLMCGGHYFEIRPKNEAKVEPLFTYDPALFGDVPATTDESSKEVEAGASGSLGGVSAKSNDTAEDVKRMLAGDYPHMKFSNTPDDEEMCID